MNDAPLREWDALSAPEQLQLREEYGRYLDQLPPTCDPQAKLTRFQAWLAQRGVRFSPRS